MDQGSDFALTIGIFQKSLAGSIPVDITGYSFKGQMRSNTDPTGTAVAEFVFTILNQSTNKGQVVMSLTNATTSALKTTIANGEENNRPLTPYVFDVKMKDTSLVISRILQGLMEVSPQATLETFP